MHDPKLLAILDRREPVTIEWSKTYPNGGTIINSLGGLADLGYDAEAFTGWCAMLTFNLTIAALLGVAARRALYQTNVLGGV